MLLGIIVIVLRETLEASILISLLLSVAYPYRQNINWLLHALALGTVGAVTYAINLAKISDAFNYVGQEITNSILQYSIFILLGIVFVLHNLNTKKIHVHMVTAMTAAVAFAIVREGGELVVFYSGILQGGVSVVHAATSGFVGLAVGMSVGALCFYLLSNIKKSRAKVVQNIMLALIAAGMVLQATQLLVQADWLPDLPKLWDSNFLLSESSMLGQLAYVVLGYEASPSVLEIGSYLIAIVLFVGLKLTLKQGNKIEKAV